MAKNAVNFYSKHCDLCTINNQNLEQVHQTGQWYDMILLICLTKMAKTQTIFTRNTAIYA
jgi:hypothetical protein